MRIKQLLFTTIFALSIYFLPAVVEDVYAGSTVNCSDSGCNNESDCNGDCDNDVPGGCFWDGDSCEVGSPSTCPDCMTEDACDNACGSDAGTCFWDGDTCENGPPTSCDQCEDQTSCTSDCLNELGICDWTGSSCEIFGACCRNGHNCKKCVLI